MGAAAAVDKKAALRRANFRTIEIELYNFKETKREVAEEMENLQRDIDDAAFHARQAVKVSDPKQVKKPHAIDPALIKGTDLSDPTPTKAEEIIALRRRMIRQYRETLRRLEAIEWMLQCLRSDPEPAKLRLVEMLYFKRRHRQDIMMELGISQATYYRWRYNVVRLVAYRLGWVV